MQNEVVPALRQCVVATQASAVKLKIVDALLWLHLPSQPTVTPVLMRSAVHLCTPSQSPVAGCAAPNPYFLVTKTAPTTTSFHHCT